MTSITNQTCSPGRRRVLLGLLASGAGVALSPVLTASGSVVPAEGFEETYRRRRVVGVRRRVGGSGDDGSGGWQVTVDGRPLHLMRRADGSWMTMVDHYQSYPTPLAAARAAVDELGPTEGLGTPGDSGGRTNGRGAAGDRTGVEGDHHSGVHA